MVPVPSTSADGGSEFAPFVHTFETEANKYIFDVNTSQILKADSVLWDIVGDVGRSTPETVVKKHEGKYSATRILAACAEAEKARDKRGLLLSSRPSAVVMPHTEQCIAHELSSAREQLILNLTEACNFRCGYCIFGDAYPLRRAHSSRALDWSTAKRAIDDYLRCSTKAKRRAITFYGGEPLLNANVLRRSLEYIRQADDNAGVFLGVTTNGVLLDGEIADLLASFGVGITVSFDGPRHIHDHYRRRPGGQGTWNVVVKRLRRLLDRYPAYASGGKLLFNVTIGPGTDIREVDRYFRTCELLETNVSLSVSFLREGATALLNSLPPDRRVPVGVAELFDRFVGNLVEGTVSRCPTARNVKFQRACFERPFVSLHRRALRAAGDASSGGRAYVSSACIPGVRRLFVTVDGDYLPCERVPQYSRAMCIGNVREGVDAAAAYRLHKQWVECNTDDCRLCWCMPICQAGCYANGNDDGALTDAAKRRACTLCRKWLHELLVTYCRILERNPNALDYVKTMTFS